MSTTTGKAVTAPSTLYVEYSQPPLAFRPMECTTEARFLESLFLLTDDARDNFTRQLLRALPHLEPVKSVVRFMNLKLDLYNIGISPVTPFSQSARRSVPPWKQLLGKHFRVVTRFTAIGRTSIRMHHRFLTVPRSQIRRDFNNREEDAKYNQLQDGDELERQFASAEGGLVYILWQEDDKGHRFFRPHPSPFQDRELLQRPPVVKLLRQQAPELRPQGSSLPENAFRFSLELRKSDEDELGHVTNSRYTSLVYDVLAYGANAGYYANGSGSFTNSVPLPRYAQQAAIDVPGTTLSENVAIPVGSRFYKIFNVLEMYVGFENEVKVKPGVYVWSWVEKEKIAGQLDVIRFEICTKGENGQERVLSLCRAVIREYRRSPTAQKAVL
ncbi:hypothetical protein BGZ99_000308 [Dissophora globulifera]|uniref:Uncharacterized protein n=1 Tax=Dissophora globulifera TaxID=979702 RepID=A0A9P6UY95_9FUNG|nr:hypothetical protein BGZ99_000308 [Dissophora globulifera]